MSPEHFCTYLDRGYLAHGLALATSLREHCPNHLLWVLCLDDYSADCIEALASPQIKIVRLPTLEAADPALAATRASRTRIEYYFTLSPCWPRFLLENHPEIERLTYLDADLYFFGSPGAIFDELGAASLFVTEHNFPRFLRHHLRFGRFNVGILIFVNDETGRACLDHWRQQCIDWCLDAVEHGRYADQKYLDQWPALYGEHLVISRQRGVNLAPWNWISAKLTWRNSTPCFDENPLVLFHFARFRPSKNARVFQSGQLEYGIMPWKLRQFVYGAYCQSLLAAREQIRRHKPDYNFSVSPRSWHGFYRALLPRIVFGSDWLRLGPYILSGRCSLGYFSGRVLAWFKFQRPRPAPANAPALHSSMPFPNSPPPPDSPATFSKTHSSNSTFQ